MTEEQRKQCEEIINSYKEKYEKEFEEINTLGFSIDGEYTSPILRMFGFMPMGLSFFEFQFQTEESYMKWLIFLEKSNYVAGENIIELAASLSNIFNKNMDKEEAEKLLFVKSNIEEELNHYFASKEFRNIMDMFEYRYNTAIENIGWATADYFDNNKENNNNQNEENKNFNNENKINNVVENTAKEKIMSKEEQYKKCEEIINSYEEKYNKDLEEALYKIKDIPEIPEMPESDIKMVKNYISILLFSYDKSDSEWNIASPLHLEPIPQDKAKAKFYELLAEPRNKTVENIIDLTVSLSEVFGSGITKEEAEKLLFTKKSIEIDGTLSYLNIFTGATEKFIQIMQSHEKGYLEYENYEEEINSIKNIGGAIAKYFDNEENKINNVVGNTAKEKIMSNNDESTFNLLILGKTGVGKSSLINALIGEEVAKVSDAEPETDDIYPYPAEIDGKKITIYDSWGMEVGKEKIWDDIVNNKLKERGIDKPIEEWFHSVTYCIQAGGNRIEDFDAKIITKFIKSGYR